jgi:hypothetical protein
MEKKMRLDLFVWSLVNKSFTIEGFSYLLNFLGDFIVLSGLDENTVRGVLSNAVASVNEKTTIVLDIDSWLTDEYLEPPEMLAKVRAGIAMFLIEFKDKISVTYVYLNDVTVRMYEVMGSLLITTTEDNIIGLVSYIDVRFGMDSLMSLSNALDDSQLDDLALVIESFYKEKTEAKDTVSGLPKN